jgi:AraC-like DNA-binding protein
MPPPDGIVMCHCAFGSKKEEASTPSVHSDLAADATLRPCKLANDTLCPVLPGPDWLPDWIEVDYPRDHLAHQLEAQLPFPEFYGGVGLTTVIRFDDLARKTAIRRGPGSVITMGEVAASETDGPTGEPLNSVFSAITLRLLDGQTDIDGVAKMIGVGVQKLQRSLRREGVDYRNLLNLAKRHRAQALLSETTLPVIDIAFSLGYSDHANFFRAFKRVVGVTPSKFRAARMQ